MYFFNLKGLVKELSTRRLTSREGYRYILGFICLKVLPYLLSLEAEKATPALTPNMFLANVIGLGFALTIAWLILQNLFVSNGGDDSPDFAENLLAVGFVTTVRLSAVLFPISLIFQFFFAGMDKPDFSLMGWTMIALVVIILAALWIWLKDTNRALRAIKKGRSELRPPTDAGLTS